MNLLFPSAIFEKDRTSKSLLSHHIFLNLQNIPFSSVMADHKIVHEKTKKHIVPVYKSRLFSLLFGVFVERQPRCGSVRSCSRLLLFSYSGVRMALVARPRARSLASGQGPGSIQTWNRSTSLLARTAKAGPVRPGTDATNWVIFFIFHISNFCFRKPADSFRTPRVL